MIFSGVSSLYIKSGSLEIFLYEKFSVFSNMKIFLFISKPAYEVSDNSIQGIGSMDYSVFFIFQCVSVIHCNTQFLSCYFSINC